MKPADRFKLTEVDKQSDLWVRLSKHFEDRLNELRTRNDAQLDEKQTADLRGRIAEIKAMRSLGDNEPIIE